MSFVRAYAHRDAADLEDCFGFEDRIVAMSKTL